ncbi:alpha/beta fold hydrolase [Candidatus Kaiserbacteria bacterium]|nr:alpha/beta fold hydrolase [Candidatus Kaiserbacteria bacterium]
MQRAYVAEIVTPKKVSLNGLWFGPRKAKRVFIFVHGLTASAFSMHRLLSVLVDSRTAVLTFNNRGFEQIAEVKRKMRRKSAWFPAGAGREIFKECVDDIQGAINLARKMKAKQIYLLGHSTGAQKAIYWASKQKRNPKVKGIVLLGPLSDYAGAVAREAAGKLKKAVDYAKNLVQRGHPNTLMPSELGPWFICDAQRFLSLYTPDSHEEIFTYAQPKKIPRTLQKVKIPILVLLAGADEHGDRPAKDIARWFQENIDVKHDVIIIPGANHSFFKREGHVLGAIAHFIKDR